MVKPCAEKVIGSVVVAGRSIVAHHETLEFVIEKVRMADGVHREIPDGEMQVWIVLEGSGQIDWHRKADPVSFSQGDVVVIPAALSGAMVRITTTTQWLEVSVPI